MKCLRKNSTTLKSKAKCSTKVQSSLSARRREGNKLKHRWLLFLNFALSWTDNIQPSPSLHLLKQHQGSDFAYSVNVRERCLWLSVGPDVRRLIKWDSNTSPAFWTNLHTGGLDYGAHICNELSQASWILKNNSEQRKVATKEKFARIFLFFLFFFVNLPYWGHR